MTTTATKTRIANNTLQLVRNGQRVRVKPGEQVELTQEELDDIKTMNPGAVRTLRNETEAAPKANIPSPGGKQTKATATSDEGL